MNVQSIESNFMYVFFSRKNNNKSIHATILFGLAYHSHISLLLISVLRSYLYNAIIHDDEDDAVDMMKGNREWNEV